MKKSTALAEKILDKALELAANSSWEDVRLQQVADALEISLEDVRQHYRQKDDLAEALFDRADRVMLTVSENAEFKSLCGSDRIRMAIMAWLGALAPHRRPVIDIFKYKLEPGHIHLQVLGVLRVSRTVQWILEATGSRTKHVSRIMEEIGTSSVYLAALVYWLTDRSKESCKTGDFIDKLLKRSEKLARWVNPDAVIMQTSQEPE